MRQQKKVAVRNSLAEYSKLEFKNKEKTCEKSLIMKKQTIYSRIYFVITKHTPASKGDCNEPFALKINN